LGSCDKRYQNLGKHENSHDENTEKLVMVYEYLLSTKSTEIIDITRQVTEAIKSSEVQSGICIVYCPHTTAGITVNENADPDVVQDILYALEKAFPQRPEFTHMEGNSPAHLKSSYAGCSQTFIVEKASILLGTWQGIYFCEFDGPRKRRFFVKVKGD